MNEDYPISVPEPKLTILSGTPEKCGICGIDFTKRTLELHHSSYDENEAHYICSDCHSKVHHKDGYFDELNPDKTRKESHGFILDRADYASQTHLKPEYYYLLQEASEISGVRDGTLITVLVHRILKKHNGDVMKAINNV